MCQVACRLILNLDLSLNLDLNLGEEERGESFLDESGAIKIPLSNSHEYVDRYGAVAPVRWLRPFPNSPAQAPALLSQSDHQADPSQSLDRIEPAC